MEELSFIEELVCGLSLLWAEEPALSLPVDEDDAAPPPPTEPPLCVDEMELPPRGSPEREKPLHDASAQPRTNASAKINILHFLSNERIPAPLFLIGMLLLIYKI